MNILFVKKRSLHFARDDEAFVWRVGHVLTAGFKKKLSASDILKRKSYFCNNYPFIIMQKDYKTNAQLQLAYDFVQFTGRNIFLTGKAGTGKTTFLHNLKEHSPKRLVVTAPTGVAAINAAGVTIHSFFQVSFGPLVPNYQPTEIIDGVRQTKINRFSKEKINIIRSMDLLVIDEISMVRADLLDAIDSTLRRFRNRNLPFGGVQLLMIGDLQQLSPVVKEDEWQLLRKHYETPYFFSSLALQKTDYVSIELQHVFRQKDKIFIDLLNKIRDNKLDNTVISALKARYKPDFNADNSGYIILTTHNYKAHQINDSRLDRIKAKSYTFDATVWGNFPEYTYPTDAKLILKKGVQVMFVKNDPNPEKLFYNGKIGTVVEISKEVIKVKCEGDEESITVKPLEWEKAKYSLDDKTKEIKESVEGTFTQLPLKLAWAITIHKSQGLTFEKAVIDAQEAFAHGQVYVALSRCKSLEGLVLSTPILSQSIKYDQTIDRFTKHYEEHQPDSAELEASRKAYEQQLLTMLFDFESLQRQLYYAVKISHEHESSMEGNPIELFHEITRKAKAEITEVAGKFQNQLLRLFAEGGDVEKNSAIQERLKKASVYFSEKMKSLVIIRLQEINIETDNKAVRKKFKNALDNLNREAAFKTACLEACHNGFVVKDFLDAQAKASIGSPAKSARRKKTEEVASEELGHPEIYRRLKAWRDAKVAETGWQVYRVLSLRSIRELSGKLPITPTALKAIKGIGQKKLEMFGDELLQIIIDFCEEKDFAGLALDEPEREEKKPKTDTKQVSFELWKAGKSITEIAEERNYAESTIEGHLAHFVGTGEIAVEKLVSTEKVKHISEFFIHENTQLLSEAKTALGDEVSYSELRFVLNHLRFTKAVNTS